MPYVLCTVVYLQSYSIVLRRFNIAINFHNNSRPMLVQTVQVFQFFPSLSCLVRRSTTLSYCLVAWIRLSHSIPLSISFALYTHCLQQDNIILCFYLSLVRANIKVATPKATSTTATGQQKLWKICTPWMVHKMALAGAYVRL